MEAPTPVTTVQITGPDPRTTSREGWVTAFADSVTDRRALVKGDVVSGVLEDGSHDLWEVLVADGPASMRYYVLGPVQVTPTGSAVSQPLAPRQRTRREV